MSAPRPPIPNPGDLAVGPIVSRTIEILLARFVPLAGTVAVVYSPYLLYVLARGTGAGDPTRGFVPWLLQMLLGPVATAAATHAVVQHLRGRDVAIGAAVGAATARLGTYIGVALVAGLLIAVGLVLLVVPGLIAMCALAVAAPVAVLEGRDVSGALGRSIDLTAGHRMTIFLIFLAFVLIGAIFGYVLGLFGLGSFGLLLQLAATVVAQTGAAIAGVLIYQHLRATREGADLDTIGAALDR